MNKKEKMYVAIERHGRQLQAIFPATADSDPVTLAKKLRRLEGKANRLVVDYCNGVIDSEQWEKEEERILAALHRIIGPTDAVFVNSDPRGYALKIRDEYVREHNLQIYRDWGGYGILAPDFSEGN